MILRIIFILFTGLLTTVFAVSCGGQFTLSQSNDQIVAVADITGTSDSTLSGTVTLIQTEQSGILPTVKVKADISGLPKKAGLEQGPFRTVNL